MDSFRTPLSLQAGPFSLNHHDRILSIGSCFADQMGAQLLSCKFNIQVNPFGILYNPISIQQHLDRLLHSYTYVESDIFQHQGRWNSFYHHSSFSQLSSDDLLSHLQKTTDQVRAFFRQSNRILITFGTAWVYIHRKVDGVVANCHKLPADAFHRRRLSVQEIVSAYRTILPGLKKELPDMELLLTVSPVRHLRDGFVENQRSKATLLLAVEQLCQQFDFVHYFPAYEIMIDDLRDYRFYNTDMLHPNESAHQYIWQQLQHFSMNSETLQLLKIIDKTKAAAQHRPFFPASDQHRQFVRKQLEQIRLLEDQYPALNFQKEREIFQRQLSL
jgi:hypothetical protein